MTASRRVQRWAYLPELPLHDLTVDIFCRDVPHLHDVLHNEVQTIDGVIHVTSYLVTEIKYQSSINLARLMEQANGIVDD